MSADADIAILGAGCAGLSLAVALQRQNVRARVLLLEPRSEYIRDRTWCFWDAEQHPFSEIVSHRWDQWRVASGDRCFTRKSSRYSYCHIAGSDFYNVARAAVEASATQMLQLGVRVSSVSARRDGLQAINTNVGQLSASVVFDSRPQITAAPSLVQRFAGWHVRSDQRVFDPQTVDLMRFLPSDVEGRVRFLYILPFSSTEALVEMTYLDRPHLVPAQSEEDLEACCNQLCSGYEVLYREKGALPMGGGSPVTNTPGIHAIGIRGGRLKPSSGYGFLRIQRHSAAIARALSRGTALPANAEPAIFKYLDALFLTALSRSPKRAAALFMGLFERSDPDKLVRFLGEQSSMAEALQAALRLPRLEMIRALAHRPSPAGILRRDAAENA